MKWTNQFSGCNGVTNETCIKTIYWTKEGPNCKCQTTSQFIYLLGFDTVNRHVCKLEMHRYSWNIQMIRVIMHNIDSQFTLMH